MAARDRNLFAWQAYVIVTSIISLLLLVGVFFLWKIHTDLLKSNAEQKTQLTTANAEKGKADMRVNRLKNMLGYGTATVEDVKFMVDTLKDDPEMVDVEKNYTTDMTVFSASQEKKNYREFPVTLLATILERNNQVAEAEAMVARLKDEKANLDKSHAEALGAAQSAQKKAEDDLAATRQQHTEQIAKLNAEKTKIQELVTAYKSDFEKRISILDAAIVKLKADNATQAATLLAQNEKIQRLQKENFDEPAGSVINVANGSRTVWINLGAADGLREGVSFVVLDEKTRNVAEGKIKAEMVVERVTDDHMAVCTVTSGVSKYPVLPGDLVYSPAWRKGRVTGFALVGLMDINGDGRDDRDLIKSVIQSAGGKVDAEILPTGETKNYSGMDINTAYVVVGTDVAVGEQANQEQQERSTKYAKFMGDAKNLSIPQISTNNLMGYLKSKNDTRTVPLGTQTRASDFEAKAANGVVPETAGVVSEIFRQRKPAK
ncbi:MAG: hypothetical protein IT423_17965 [Pirellulaceae bacterium]|nr:hypothetical protein [Pirellulaceae bacterium]